MKKYLIFPGVVVLLVSTSFLGGPMAGAQVPKSKSVGTSEIGWWLGSKKKAQPINKQLVISGDVLFEKDSSVLSAAAGTQLANLAPRVVVSCKSSVVALNAYTDSDGLDNYNIDLSKRRAQSVANYLAAKKVPMACFSCVGHGEANPIALNDSPSNKAKNRRVVFVSELRQRQITTIKTTENQCTS